MLHNIVVNSPEYACFHEAGHAEAALRVGARVLEMELYKEQPRSYGRTRVEKKQDSYIEQSRCIALGGFAAEYILYRAGRIVNEDGTSMSESQFIQYAYGNAEQDFAAFWATFNLPLLNTTQKEVDKQFMSFAIGMAQQDMKAATVERIADALLGAQKLTEAEVTEAATLRAQQQLVDSKVAPNTRFWTFPCGRFRLKAVIHEWLLSAKNRWLR